MSCVHHRDWQRWGRVFPRVGGAACAVGDSSSRDPVGANARGSTRVHAADAKLRGLCCRAVLRAG